MEIQAKTSDRNLLLELSGDIDHHGARNALRELELAIDAEKIFVTHELYHS